MSNKQLENAKRAVFVDSLYEDITPENSPQHSIDYEPIGDDGDWLSINSEMERELLTSTITETMDAMVDKIMECESQEPMIPLKIDDNVNVAEEDDSECPVDPDPAIIQPISRTVTESVILKMTKRNVTYNDDITLRLKFLIRLLFPQKSMVFSNSPSTS